MKKILLLIPTLTCCLLGSLSAKEINILFIGNSFTFRSELPDLVKEVFESGHPDLTVNVEKLCYGGQDLFRHHDLYFSETRVRLNTITVPEIEEKMHTIQAMLDMDEAPDFYQDYWDTIGRRPESWQKIQSNLKQAFRVQERLIKRIDNNGRKKWDYVVLQSWQDIVPNVDAGYGAYAQKLARIAKEEGSEVILYITAPHAQNKEPVSEPLKWEKTQMELQTVAQLCERIQPFTVVPVGLGIKNIQQDGTEIMFRYLNDGHPTQYSVYLAANMFYAAFFNQSPVGLEFDTVVENVSHGKGEGKDPDGGDAQVVFKDPVKTELQQAAYDAVVEFQSDYLKQ